MDDRGLLDAITFGLSQTRGREFGVASMMAGAGGLPRIDTVRSISAIDFPMAYAVSSDQAQNDREYMEDKGESVISRPLHQHLLRTVE